MIVKLKVSVCTYDVRPGPDGISKVKIPTGATRRAESDRKFTSEDGDWDKARATAEDLLKQDGWKVRTCRVEAGRDSSGATVPVGLTAIVEPRSSAPSRKVR